MNVVSDKSGGPATRTLRASSRMAIATLRCRHRRAGHRPARSRASRCSIIDLAELPRILSPPLSPDGRSLAYMLSRADWKIGPPDLAPLAAGRRRRRAGPAHLRRSRRHSGRPPLVARRQDAAVPARRPDFALSSAGGESARPHAATPPASARRRGHARRHGDLFPRLRSADRRRARARRACATMCSPTTRTTSSGSSGRSSSPPASKRR